MILTEDKHFAEAVKSGRKIKRKTIYYTGKLEQTAPKPLKIGDYVKGNGIFAGIIYDENGQNPKKLFVAMKDVNKKMTWDEAMKYNYGKYHLPNIREIMQILLNLKVINKGLLENKGQDLSDFKSYWSSSEYTDNHSWFTCFDYSYGFIYDNKKGNTFVRPVLAL